MAALTGHMTSSAIAGPCEAATGDLERHVTGDPAHVVGVQLFCAAHCPRCHAVPPAERRGEVVGLVGEQGGLF